MEIGHFYYLKESYYIDFPDPNIQRNHETIDGEKHNKPCFCAIPGDNDIYWLIPISSKIEKYHAIAQKKIEKYGKCDAIVFGEVLGYEKAFLVQNMIPVTDEYILEEYFSKANVPVKVKQGIEKDLIKNAKSLLNKQRHGVNVIFPDVIAIENKLKEKENNEKT